MNKFSSKRILITLVMIGVIIFASSEVSTLLYNNESQQSEQKFNAEIFKLQNLLQNRLDIYKNVLISTKAFFENSDYVNKEEFNSYFKSLDLFNRYPGISALTYIEKVSDSNKNNFENTVNADTSLRLEGVDAMAPYTIKSNSQKDYYYVFKYIEPFNPLTTSLGLDLSDTPSRLELIERAIIKGQVVSTGKITLLGATANQGFLVYLPIFNIDMPIDTPENRDAATIGFLNAVFRVNVLFDGVLGNAETYKDISIDIYDNQEHNEDHLLFSSGKISGTNIISETAQIQVGDRTWDIEFKTENGYGLSLYEKNRHIMGFIGVMIIGSMLATTIYFLSTSRERAVSIAENMTKKLRESEQTLKSVVEGVNVILFAIDINGKFTLSEGKGLASIGLKAGEAVGNNYKDFYKDYPEIIEDVKRSLKGEEFTAVRQVGNRTFETSYTCLIKNEKVVSIIGVAVDVTDRETSKTKVEVRTKELERLNKVMVDRELKMIELKEEIKTLKLNTK